jgi:hypothetical protein
MRILRERSGFQADHSSSSYLFYAVDRPVSAKGQQVAHRFSSRAEVDEHTARYLKWGDSELSSSAYEALLAEHYDVMASESYDMWTLMLAVPKTAQMTSLLAPFHGLDDGEFVRLDVRDFSRRLVVEVVCNFDYEGPVFGYEEDSLERLVELLVPIRQEIMQGNISFLQAVASFYRGDDYEEDSASDEEKPAAARPPANLTKAELQRQCAARGIAFRQSWTKQQLRDALSGPAPLRIAGAPPGGGKPAKLSKAARAIVESLDRP